MMAVALTKECNVLTISNEVRPLVREKLKIRPEGR